MVGEQPATHILLPGVFYVPEEQPTLEDLGRLARCEARANELLQMTSEELRENDIARSELGSYLEPDFSPKMQRIAGEIAKLVAPTDTAERETRQQLNADFNNAEIALLEPLLGTAVQFRYRRPGEIAYPTPNHLYFPWSPTAVTLPFGDVYVLPEPTEDLNELENRINSILGALNSYPGGLRKKEINAFERELEKVMYPGLRKLRDKSLEAKIQRSGRRAEAQERDIKFEYDTACRAWVNSFVQGRVQIRTLQSLSTPERPGILYLRGQTAGPASEFRQMLENLTSEINGELRKSAHMQENPEDQHLYRFLANLQYPQLKMMDERRRRLMRNRLDPTEDEIRREQEAHSQWRTMYNAWIASFKDSNVEIRLCSAEDNTLGDPSIVYYRGPLGREMLPETPESAGEKQDPPLTRQDVDRAVLLLEQYKNLAHHRLELAGRLDDAHCLPPSVLGRLDEWRAARAARASGEIVAAKENAAIHALSMWEKKIQNEARGLPLLQATSDLPASVQGHEKEINDLLQQLHPSDKTLDKLNKLIAPYWKRQLIKLRARRVARLRSDGVPEEQIGRLDMSINSFNLDFENFKAKSRTRGFKIVSVEMERGFYDYLAQDPIDPGEKSFSPGAQPVVMSLANTILDPSWSLAGLNPTEKLEVLFQMEQEINELLAVRHRRLGSTGEPEISKTRNYKDENRLIFLLQPFFPRTIDMAWRQLHASLDMVSPANVADQEGYVKRKRREAYRRFLDLYAPWITRIESTQVHLTLGSKDNNVEDNFDGTLYVDYQPAPVEQILDGDITPRRLAPEWQKIEDETNDLLQSRNSRPLTLAEEKRLRALLRVVMPGGLVNSDDKLRSLSQQVRSGHVSRDVLFEYSDALDRWSIEYYKWLDEISPKGIRLHEAGPGAPFSPSPKSNAMLIRIDSTDKIPDDSTENTGVPMLFKMRESLVNRYISGDSTLTLEKMIQCDNLIHQVWDRFGEDARRQWHAKLYAEYNVEPYSITSMTSTRIQAAVAAQLDTAFGAFVERVRRGSERLRLEFVETRPDDFILMPAPVSSDGVPSNEELLNQFVVETMNINHTSRGRSILSRALEEFFSLTAKVESRSSLTIEERRRVVALLTPLSEDQVSRLLRGILRLWADLADNRLLSRNDQSRLIDLTVTQIWHFWGDINPAIRSSVYQYYPIEYQLKPPSPGIPGPSPGTTPVVDPPTEAEMDAVINNISTAFDKYKSGVVHGREAEYLKHVLLPLLPTGLKNLQRQGKRLCRKRATSKRLTTIESLKISELQPYFDHKFRQWINPAKSFNDVLNSPWRDPQALRELYSLAKVWEGGIASTDADRSNATTSANKNSEGLLLFPNLEDTAGSSEGRTFAPTTTVSAPPADAVKHKQASAVIKDDTLRDHQEIRELLRQFTEYYEESVLDRLLLDHMPPPLQELYEEILSLRDRERSSHLEFDETQRLRSLAEDFATDYMAWYSGLTVRESPFRSPCLQY